MRGEGGKSLKYKYGCPICFGQEQKKRGSSHGLQRYGSRAKTATSFYGLVGTFRHLSGCITAVHAPVRCSSVGMRGNTARCLRTSSRDQPIEVVCGNAAATCNLAVQSTITFINQDPPGSMHQGVSDEHSCPPPPPKKSAHSLACTPPGKR